MKEANINFVHAFPFSPREGTPAAKMKMLSSEIINERAKEIRDLGHKNKIKYFKNYMFHNFIYFVSYNGSSIFVKWKLHLIKEFIF